jgi:protein TonB
MQFYESLDDLAFKNRNKEYGSYLLRRKYRKYLTISIFSGLFLLGVVVAVPLISAIVNKNRLIRDQQREVGIEMKTISQEELPPPPPPPPPPEALVEKVRFTAPVVVEDTLVETGLATQDDLSAIASSEVPSEETEIEIKEEKVQVIEQKVESKIFTVVEEQPQFPGGEEALAKFLKESIKYPEEAKSLNISGIVYLTFIVEEDGSISNLHIIRGIGGGCDEEALRVVKSMASWIPGKQRGVPVRVQFNLPVRFTLKG